LTLKKSEYVCNECNGRFISKGVDKLYDVDQFSLKEAKKLYKTATCGNVYRKNNI
jgi:DNA-directed RNA polymerase subunit RPC12/RpoP